MNDPLRDPVIDAKLASIRSERERRKEKRSLEDLEWILGDARGRRFFAMLLDYGQVFSEPAPGNDSLTNFNNGKRFIGVMLLGKMLANHPEAFLRMINEATSETRQEELEDKKVKEGNDA